MLKITGILGNGNWLNDIIVKEITKVLFFGGILALVAGCATPTTPGGGPRDQQGPSIISTEPETGTTNFAGGSITLHFSEFVNRNTLSGAISVEPDIGIRYESDWGRKSVELTFTRELPDLTTVIITIGTDLQDVNGNKMGQPVKVAVSTGPEIDDGKLVGRVIDARTGKGIEGHRVLLFRDPADLSKRANYSAETDTSGEFQFSYLGQGRYTAFWLDDRNRNKTWEPALERAQPFRDEFVELEKGDADTLGTLFIANSDTSAPALQGIGLFSSQRLRLRFSENILTTDSTGIVISDTLGNRYAGAYPLYVAPEDSFVLFAQSEKPLSAGEDFQVEVKNIIDRFGNLLPVAQMGLTGSAQDDTTRQRIIKTNSESGMYPREPLDLLFAKPLTETEILDSLGVVRGSDLVKPWEKYEIQNNRLRIYPESNQWQSGVSYEFRLWNPLRQRYRKFSPVIWHENDLGGIAVQLAAADTTGNTTYRLRLKTKNHGILVDTSFVSHLEIDGLPPVPFQVTVYHDRNSNGRWDHGSVNPFRAPEPYFIRNNVPVREGFVSDVTVRLE